MTQEKSVNGRKDTMSEKNEESVNDMCICNDGPEKLTTTMCCADGKYFCSRCGKQFVPKNKNYGNGYIAEKIYGMDVMGRKESIVEAIKQALNLKDSEIEKLRGEVEALRKFVSHILESYSWGHDVDGGDAQDKAIELGLVELRPCNPDDYEGEKEVYFTKWTPKEALSDIKEGREK